MINQEIVTYLKGEEKLNKGNFIKQWAEYCSFIKADKDSGQYLPYLFVIYYFGPSKAIQEAAKELIDLVSPKEILQFQDNFVKIVRQLDNEISAVYFDGEDDLIFGEFFSPDEDDLNFKTPLTKEINKIQKIHYSKPYILSMLMPVFFSM